MVFNKQLKSCGCCSVSGIITTTLSELRRFGWCRDRASIILARRSKGVLGDDSCRVLVVFG